MHPCWRISHRILSTIIFGRLELVQINRYELFFLCYIYKSKFPCLSTIFLDKCDSVQQQTTGEIHRRGLITIIGLAIGLEFPTPTYIPVDLLHPTFLLDFAALECMEMLQDWRNDGYIWLNSNKAPIYILPSWIGDSFDARDPDRRD
ncbi:unnamed protein product [Lactuca saligna]|uniref:Uncharacterized protein n=1 Tax=Lactuca saligna TaxID=75948 RepID=A0AA36EPP9_LACSI|nr:unnamed protein product [Lactuca saligna]